MGEQSYSERQLFEKAYERLKSEFEVLLAEKETITLEDIDNFVPSDDLVMQRKERRQLLLKRILLPIEKDLEK